MGTTQFGGYESLRDIAGYVTGDEQLHNVLHLTSIGAATLPRRLQRIAHRVELTFNDVKRAFLPQTMRTGFHGCGLYRMKIIDSSTVTLCLKRYLRADYRHTKSGNKTPPAPRGARRSNISEQSCTDNSPQCR